ncbi:hypothetical protein Patl1_11942 [Pistacia atlantica]|uniref:Uncharacterized protein n=1 Tax=Pistacia atlantica TaxID=434234 RepID=A0ACC1A557_9ROSI|nr:hypothetical protein Patl1_11942 [Pistacia atlantica]
MVEAPKKKSSKSLYARVTDTGIDPELAAKKLNVDWDSAAEIGEADDSDEAEVPAAVHFNLRPHPCSLCPFNSMAPPASAVVLPVVSKITREPDEFVDDLHELNFLAFGDEPDTLVKKESPQNEKQISVDPISLSLREPSFNFMLPPVLTSPRDTTVPLPAVPAVLPPAKTKFISCSLPSSATSSPRFGSILSMKKWKINENQPSPKQVDNLVRQRSLAHSRLSLVKDAMLVKSKSCGEGRASAPSDELELCFSKPKAPEYNKISHTNFSKAETNRDVYKNVNNVDPCDENFKCSALCMFLPGFGKAKPERARKEEAMENVISRTVSLEKFECGSWASSAIVHDHDEDGDSMNHLYFDLPLELIRNNSNDAHCPINAAFVFDKDLKGVLKNGSTSGRTSARKSHESSRHVRFSVSSPTPSYPSSPASCITP